MSTNQLEKTPPKSGSLWARLLGMKRPGQTEPDKTESTKPEPANPGAAPAEPAAPAAAQEAREEAEMLPTWTEPPAVPPPVEVAGLAEMTPAAPADPVEAAISDLRPL